MQYETPILLPRKRQLSRKKIAPSVECFLVTMLFVIAVQGTYLAYVVGILTNLERRFGISSKKSGSLLSFYDIGHTVSVVLIGFLANDKHLPRITATGVLLSAVSMFVLALPMLLFGAESSDEASLSHEHEYILRNICDPARVINSAEKNCELQEKEHFWAFCILIIGQILAGIAAAPFNTVAYVYVDNNLEDKTKSPFYLSLLSSMYAFAPAFGFALSAVITRLYSTIFDVPSNVSVNNDEWIGAWWLGFVIFGLFYLAAIVPLLFFPKNLLKHDSSSFEMQQLRNKCSHDHDDHQLSLFGYDERLKETFCGQLKAAVIEFPGLVKNRVFISMIIGWMFGSYLTSGYCTYLPKYIETQFGHSASVADTYAGIVSIGSIAVSTALGGYLLTKFNPSPRKALLFLIATWFIIVITYLVGAIVGCNAPQVKELLIAAINQEKFIDKLECSFECQCTQVDFFNPVNHHARNYFSPCHAGCREYNSHLQKWDLCLCADNGPVETGLYTDECNAIFIYIASMFMGLFLGNLFFMTTMMIVLRSVYDDEKVLALSFASCTTNIMGFIPGPIIFGWIIDEDCLLWHSKCPHDHGNCVIYDNKAFRQSFHLTSAGFQFLAVISVVICYIFSRKFTFPEEERKEEMYDEYVEKQADGSYVVQTIS
uniref:Solute carrier organic anion transporter family member n=1 Tax=Brugia malayi TaxID=6279 RepID=A0A8L7T352_BRUMA